jgi:catechol 2,3-dioxygenase-like lactoylglutathione lyase family enzyme
MPTASPLWPARLDHLCLASPDPEGLAEFYRDAMGMTPRRLDRETLLIEGKERRLLITKGERNDAPIAAMRLGSARQLAALRRDLEGSSVETTRSPTPLFGDDAFAVCDPDGRRLVFGVPDETIIVAESRASSPPARLQHFVVATTDVERWLAFYRDRLGFIVADEVCVGESVAPEEKLAAVFLRADVEHHSIAAFKAPEARFDHVAFETTCWNDIRDWADRFADMRIAAWWGPGRHGVGRNLFFMIKDPDGNNIELSAEIELMPRYMPHRRWPSAAQTLNAWGPSWNRME